MATMTRLELEQRLSQVIGDDIEVAVTTAIAATKLIVSTNLNAYDFAGDGHFDNWWVSITDKANAGVVRRLGSTTYATSTGTAYVYGTNLTTDGANLATVRMHQFNPVNKVLALNRALEQIPLFTRIDNRTLITGNLLADGHLDDWSSATALSHWTASNITLAQTSTAGLKWGGDYSAKCTAGAADGYIYQSSILFPRLADAQNHSMSIKGWVWPQKADDTFLEIYYIQADGTTETLTSTTTTYASRWNFVELESQSIPDNVEELQVRLRVHTSGQYAYFDDIRFNGAPISEIHLPTDFQHTCADNNGHVSQAYIQSYGDVDDNNPYFGKRDEMAVEIIDDGTYEYIRTLLTSTPKRIRLVGFKTIPRLASDSATLPFDDGRVNLIVYKAAQLLYEMEAGVMSSEARDRYNSEASKWERKYREASFSLSMPKPSELR